MQAKKYQIFVSSTYTDLIDERREVIEAIIDLGHIPAGMEGFPAIDMEQFRYIQKVIDQCDYYILVVGGRYGSLANDGVSFTEKEYRYAVDSGKVVIAFVLDEAAYAQLPALRIESTSEGKAKLLRFINDVKSGRLVRNWTDRNSLSKSVMKSLIAAFEEFPGEGWVRASVQANEDVLAQINEIRLRNDELLAENAHLKSQSKPKVTGLAPLNDSYNITYTYFGQGSNDRKAQLTITWREIFLGLAPHLGKPTGFAPMISALETFLRDAGYTQGRVINDINSVNAQQIRVQLVAHGLLTEIRGQNIKGTLGEWVQLSDLGRSVMMEELSIKATPKT